MLGIDRGTDVATARAHYLALMRVHHPDLAGPAGAADAQRVTQAWALVEAAIEDGHLGVGDPGATAPAGGPAAAWRDEASWTRLDPGTVHLVDAGTIGLHASREDAMLALLDVAHEMGEVSFVDVDLGLMEVIVQFVGQPTCSLVVSLQGRADRVDAFCTIDSYDATPPPPIDQVTRLLASRLQRA